MPNHLKKKAIYLRNTAAAAFHHLCPYDPFIYDVDQQKQFRGPGIPSAYVGTQVSPSQRCVRTTFQWQAWKLLLTIPDTAIELYPHTDSHWHLRHRNHPDKTCNDGRPKIFQDHVVSIDVALDHLEKRDPYQQLLPIVLFACTVVYLYPVIWEWGAFPCSICRGLAAAAPLLLPGTWFTGWRVLPFHLLSTADPYQAVLWGRGERQVGDECTCGLYVVESSAY